MFKFVSFVSIQRRCKILSYSEFYTKLCDRILLRRIIHNTIEKLFCYISKYYKYKEEKMFFCCRGYSHKTCRSEQQRFLST